MMKHFLAIIFPATGLILSSSVLAAQMPRADNFEHLCPASGPVGLAFGQSRNTQDKAALAALKRDGALGQGKAQFTSWSDRLYAVEWHKPSPDGQLNQTWLDEVEQLLLAAGWKPLRQPNLKSSFATHPRMVTKTVTGSRLVIEYDAPGIKLIRCADLDLLELDARERDGDLAPGSPRPLAPVPPTLPFALPDTKVCATRELTDAFAGILSPSDLGALAEKHFPLTDPASDLAAYERRLGIWLEWKLRTNGGLSEEEIWALDPNAGRYEGGNDAKIALLGTMGEAFEALKTKDGRRLCEAMIAILGGLHADSKIEASESRRRNSILEAEAARLGIALN